MGGMVEGVKVEGVHKEAIVINCRDEKRVNSKSVVASLLLPQPWPPPSSTRSTMAFPQTSAVSAWLHIYHHIAQCTPEFRVAPSGMAWKGADSDGVVAMPSAEIKWAQWIRVARNFQLRVGMRDHRKEKFDGFIREVAQLQSFVAKPCL